MDRLTRVRLNWLMDNEPERILELYQNGRMLDLEDQVSRDLQQADQYIKDLVAKGMSETQAEDRAVELILAPAEGPEFSDNPPKPVPEPTRSEIIDCLWALEEGFDRQGKAKVINLKPKS